MVLTKSGDGWELSDYEGFGSGLYSVNAKPQNESAIDIIKNRSGQTGFSTQGESTKTANTAPVITIADLLNEINNNINLQPYLSDKVLKHFNVDPSSVKKEDVKYSISDDMVVQDGKARWTDKRIDSLIREYGATHDDKYSKAYAVMMSPLDFIKLTLPQETFERWNESLENLPEEMKSMSYDEMYGYTIRHFLPLV